MAARHEDYGQSVWDESAVQARLAADQGCAAALRWPRSMGRLRPLARRGVCGTAPHRCAGTLCRPHGRRVQDASASPRPRANPYLPGGPAPSEAGAAVSCELWAMSCGPAMVLVFIASLRL